jgi:predicted permease
MEAHLRILAAVAAVFMVLGVGFVLRHLRWLNETADRSLMDVVVRLLVPCLIVTNVLGNPALMDVANLLWPPLWLGLFIVAGFVVGQAAVWLGGRRWLASDGQRHAFISTVGLCNYYYIPMALMAPPVVMGGAEAVRATLGVLMVAMVGGEVAMWTLGVVVLSGGLRPGWWRRLCNAPALTVVLCVVANLIIGRQILPEFVRVPVGWLGGCAVPLGLLLVGATIRDHVAAADWRGAAPVVGLASLLRLGLLPVLMLGALVLLADPLGLSRELRLVMVIQAAMPSGMFTIMLAKLYGADAPTAIRVVIGTSLGAIVTIPFWIAYGMRLLGLE